MSYTITYKAGDGSETTETTSDLVLAQDLARDSMATGDVAQVEIHDAEGILVWHLPQEEPADLSAADDEAAYKATDRDMNTSDATDGT